MKLLLERGAKIEQRQRFSDITALSLAVERGHESTVKLLLEKGQTPAGVRIRTTGTLLSWAATLGNEEIVALLLKRGFYIEAEDNEHRTVLALAAREGMS